MSWIDKQIARVSPAWALRRQINRQRLERLSKLANAGQRGFDAVAGGRLRYDLASTSNNADSFIRDSIDDLRNHVRQLEYNSGAVAGTIRRLRNNVVGCGIRLQALVAADENFRKFPMIDDAAAARINAEAEANFALWNKQADKRLIQNFHELQGSVCAALERDGEVLVVGRESARRDRLIPYCHEVLEADRLQTPMSEFSNPVIRNGIRFDAEGAPQSYFLLRRHPGETAVISARLARDDDYEEVPAFNANGTRKVFHLFDPVRPEQSRGYSGFAAGLRDLQDHDRLREAEIMAALEDACMFGVVRSQNPMAMQQGLTTPAGDGSSRRYHEFDTNKIFYLNENEEMDVHKPTRPNEGLDGFLRLILAGTANAKDVPPEVLTQNWRDFNYSNARTVLLQFQLSCRVRQQYLIDHYCQPTYENVFRWLVIRGLVQCPGFDRRAADYLRCTWIAPGWKWVDPVKEADGARIECEQNFDSYYNVTASKGYDGDEVLEANARYLRRKQELAAKYGISFPAASADKPAAAKSEKEEETVTNE